MSFQPNFFWVNTGWGAALFVAVATTEVAGGLVLVERDGRIGPELILPGWRQKRVCTWLVLPAGESLWKGLWARRYSKKRYATKAPASATFRPRNNTTNSGHAYFILTYSPDTGISGGAPVNPTRIA